MGRLRNTAHNHKRTIPGRPSVADMNRSSSTAPTQPSAGSTCGPWLYFVNGIKLDTLDYIIAGASCLLDAVGIASASFWNTVIVVAILRNAPLREQTSNILLVMLAVSDLFKGSFAHALQSIVKLEILLGKSTCVTSTLFAAARGIVTINSAVIVAALSLERTVSVMWPFKYASYITRRRIFTALASVLLPHAVFDTLKFAGAPLKLILAVRGFLLAVSFVVTLICYGLMLRVGWRHHRQIVEQEQAVQSSENTENAKRPTHKNKALITAKYVAGTYCLCWLPHLVGVLLSLSGALSDKRAFLIYCWVAALFFLSSSLNPLIYCWRNSDIRRAALKLLHLDKYFNEA